MSTSYNHGPIDIKAIPRPNRRWIILAAALLAIPSVRAQPAETPAPANLGETAAGGNQIGLQMPHVIVPVLTQGSAPQEAPSAPPKSDADPLGWLKIIVAGIVGAIGVLATQWLTARTSRRNAIEQAAISRSAVTVAEKAADASRMSAAAAIENANVAARNADNQGIHAVARLRQEWINAVRNELAALHSLLSNYREPVENEAGAEAALREQRQREANEKVAKITLLLNAREVPSVNIGKVISRLEDISQSSAERKRRARWLILWGRVLLKEEWDRVRAELTGSERSVPRRRDRKA
jgi:hypothetical protein